MKHRKTHTSVLERLGSTGQPRACFAHFDEIISSLLERWNLPGASLAISKEGRLVYARGYGVADKSTGELVQPTSLFRIASISKCITATGIMTLVEEGKLCLDDSAFALLDLHPHPTGDRRLGSITVRHLLQHTGGWNLERAPLYDPMFQEVRIAKAMGVTPPASAETTIQYMLGQKLSFRPGTRYRYSNFGYCVLGRIIEKLSRQTYAEYITNRVLYPIGITQARLGKTLAPHRAPNEVAYYQPNAAKRASVFPEITGKIPAPYGTFSMETGDADGGWLASAIDLVRFAAHLDFPRGRWRLKSESMHEITKRPQPPAWVNYYGVPSDYYYGLGWFVRPITETSKNIWHYGGLPGSMSQLVRRYDGVAYAAIFNQRISGSLQTKLSQALYSAADSVSSWPVGSSLSSAEDVSFR